MSLLVVGSVAFDSVQTPFGKADKVLGGSATYFSISASYFTKVRLVACVGQDFPKGYFKLFNKHGVDISGLESIKGKTFSWKGKYDFDLSNARTINTKLNVFSEFDPLLSEKNKNCDHVFLANIDPEIQQKVLMQAKNPKVIACDSMNLWIGHHRKSLLKLLKKVDIFFINEAEARQLSEEINLLKAAKIIMNFGPNMVVIKKGEHGVLFFSKKWCFSAPAYLLETPKDPTGAGDSFAGGFMGYIANVNKLDQAALRKAVIYGTIMASYDVEDFSIKRLAALSKRDINSRYKAMQKMCWF